MDSPLITVFLFLCAGLCVLATQPRACAALRRTRSLGEADRALAHLVDRFELPLLLLVAAAALFARAYQLTGVPTGLSAEEALVGIEARALVETGGEAFTGRLTAQLNVWGTSQTGPLLSLFTAPFVAFMGLSVLSVRLPMLLLHLLSTAAFYGLCRRMSGRRAARIGFFLYALAPGLIMQSRWSASAQALPAMLVLSLWALSMGEDRRLWHYGSMALFGLSMYACDAAWYVIPPFILLLCAYLLAARRLPVRTVLFGAALYLAVALPALLTLVVNTFGLEGFSLLGVDIPRFDSYEHAAMGMLSPDPLQIRGSDGFDTLMDNGFELLHQTLVQRPSTENIASDLFALPNFGLYQLFMLPVAVLGGVSWLVQLYRGKSGQNGIQTLPSVASSLLFICMIGFCLIFRKLDALHFAMTLPFLTLLCVKGVSYIAQRVSLSGLLLSAMYTIGFAFFLSSYFAAEAPARIATTHYSGFTEAAAYASTLDAEHVYVSSNVYPHENPGMAVRALTAFGFNLPAQALLGETQGEDFADRFTVFYAESHVPEPSPGTLYLLRAEDTQTLDAEGFDYHEFADWVVLESIR